MSMNTVPERLAALRAAMAANGVDVYLIPVGDPHSSEYLPDHYTSLTYFSGFHGENSNFVVTTHRERRLGRRPLLCAGRERDRGYRDPADAHGRAGRAYRRGILRQSALHEGDSAGPVRPDRQHCALVNRPEKGTGAKNGSFHQDPEP
ncbi:MAG: aminopeptidase P family N-terminal domain-containing protein [Faecalibacterium prausnitzii]